MNVILFDDDVRDRLLPITYTRPVGEIRIGILTIKEKWEKWLNANVSYITQDYLSEKFPITITDENYVISGAVLPSPYICRLIKQLSPNEALLQNNDLIAAKLDATQFEHLINNEEIQELEGFDVEDTPFLRIRHLCDIYSFNKEALESDFELLTKDRVSQPISKTNAVLGAENIFIEEGAWVECSILNAQDAPIYIGKDAKVLEGSMIRNGLALCEGAVLKMGSKIYGATTIGPFSKIGGEVKNSVVMSNSNKGHEGYLGNSILGEWCNLGADTNVSNLKNNYDEVRLWDYTAESFTSTGQQFCGLIMGDHSKTGINTMFNTGTVVGVFANVFGEGYPRNFIPSFSWGGKHGFSTYKMNKAFDTATRVMSRRNKDLDDTEKGILAHVSELSKKYRKWEKKPLPEQR